MALLPLIKVGHVLSKALGHSLSSFLKQPFGREGTNQCDKLWLWKQHPMLHKAIQMQGFRWGGICYQYVNVYSFRYFVIFVSLIITFTWGIPTFTVLGKNVLFRPLYFTVEKSFNSRPIFFFFFFKLDKMYSFDPTFSPFVALWVGWRERHYGSSFLYIFFITLCYDFTYFTYARGI